MNQFDLQLRDTTLLHWFQNTPLTIQRPIAEKYVHEGAYQGSILFIASDVQQEDKDWLSKLLQYLHRSWDDIALMALGKDDPRHLIEHFNPKYIVFWGIAPDKNALFSNAVHLHKAFQLADKRYLNLHALSYYRLLPADAQKEKALLAQAMKEILEIK